MFVLPFIALNRAAIYFHKTYDWNAWMSISMGAIITFIILYVYLFWAQSRLFKSRHNRKATSIIALFVVLLYVGRSLYFISPNQIAKPEIRREFVKLHPVLRLGVSTLALMDSKTIITDASRVPDEYRKWGLPVNAKSLHYKQSDGFAYAIDLRTKGRAEWRNGLTKTYFQLMGFKAIRHGGTGDHLHVSLYCKFAPNRW